MNKNLICFFCFFLILGFVSCKKKYNPEIISYYLTKAYEKVERQSDFLKTLRIDTIHIEDRFYNIEVIRNQESENTIGYVSFFYLRQFAEVYRTDLLRTTLIRLNNNQVCYVYEYDIDGRHTYIRSLYNNITKNENALIIQWENNSCESTIPEKYQMESDPWHFNWQIGEYTEKIYSNIPHYIISRAFPEFKGTHEFLDVKRIRFIGDISYQEPDSMSKRIVFEK